MVFVDGNNNNVIYLPNVRTQIQIARSGESNVLMINY